MWGLPSEDISDSGRENEGKFVFKPATAKMISFMERNSREQNEMEDMVFYV